MAFNDSLTHHYSAKHNCWVEANITDPNETIIPVGTYCYYGLHIVIPISAILVTAMVLAIVGNFMVIMTIARHRGMRTRTNILLANLAVADILVALLDMPISLITVIHGDWIYSSTFCDFNGFAVGLGFMVSIHTLMWISIHKFFSITKPFSRPMTRSKIIMMIIAAWVWAIFYNLTPTSIIGLTDTEYKLGASQCGPAIPRALSQYIHSGINTIFNLALPIAIMAVCYYRIFKEVKDHLRGMKRFADESACNSLIEQRQITVTLCIVMSVFVLFWLPYIGYSMSLAFRGKEYVPVIANPIAYMFGYMNSACNPIIYALRSPSFRRGFKSIICGDDQRGFSSSIYGRRDSRYSTMGRMVYSFRQSLLHRSVVGRNTMQNLSFHGIQRQPQTAAGNFSPISRVARNGIADRTPEKRSPQGKDHMHRQYNNEELRDIVGYKDMNSAFKVQISQNVKKSSECCDSCKSEDKLDGDVSVLSSLNKLAEETDENEVAQTNIQLTTVNNSSDLNRQGVNLETYNEDARDSCKVTPQTLHLSNNFKISTSQPDVTIHPSPNLNILIGNSRISSSNHDIVVTTLEIKDNRIRSVSVGDVRVTCPSPPPTEPSPASCPEVQDTFLEEDLPEPQLPQRPKPPFMWQPSVDTLYGSPMTFKRKFPMRKMAVHQRMTRNESIHDDDMSSQGSSKKSSTGSQGPSKKSSTSSQGPSKKSSTSSQGPRKKSSTSSQGPRKKSSTSSQGASKTLLVSNLITSFKKSLTDLFHGEEEDSLTMQPENENVVCAGVKTISESEGVFHSYLPEKENIDKAEESFADNIVDDTDEENTESQDVNDHYI